MGIKMGIIGFGYMGHWHLKNAPKVDNVEVVAAYDIDPARVAEARETGLVGFDTLDEFLKSDLFNLVLVVANPVDILTQVAIKLSGLPENRVIGSGTVLDSARLRYKLGEHLSVDSRSVHAFIIGEHGDSEVVAWSSANVSGVPLSEMCEMRGHYKHKENTEEIAAAVKNSAYEIINKKHATYYGIAMSVKRICEVIMRDEKSILPVSHMIHGVYEIDGVSLSMPAIVGADGVESDIPINLNGEEALKLKESADSLKKIVETIEL